jgi:hypothetical protein
MQADPVFKGGSIERTREMNADPEFKAKQAEPGAQDAQDAKAKQAERTRKMHTPEFKARSSERMTTGICP